MRKKSDILQFDFYHDLSESQQQYLIKNMRLVELQSDTVLFYQGDTTEDILLLCDGEVRLFIQGEGVDEIALYTLLPSEQCIVNTSSTLTGTPAIGSAVSVDSIRGYLVSKEVVTTLMSQNSHYQNYMFSLFTIRLGKVARVLESVKFKQLDERIYDWLKEQGETTIVITHDALASRIGSTRVVVSRILKQLEREGLVKLGRGKIEIL